jgi:ribosomal protein S18 acetylase RimI-like enzyme
MTHEFSLRPVTEQDEELLIRLYASTRADEVAAWGWSTEQQDAFLRMQYHAQKRTYELIYSDSTQSVIETDQGQPAGRLILSYDNGDTVLTDIALLPEWRNRGIGAAVIAGVLEKAGQDNRAVRLQVLKGSPAARLYERLGFIATGESATHITMKWSPSCGKTTQPG